MATRTRSLSPPPSINNRSPFSLTKANDEIDGATDESFSHQHLQRNTNEQDLTTSGRTYKELVEQLENDPSEDMTEESGRRAWGVS